MTEPLTLPAPPEGLKLAQIVSRTKDGPLARYPEHLDILLEHHRANLLFSSDCLYALAHSNDPAMIARYPEWEAIGILRGRRVLCRSVLDLTEMTWGEWRAA